MFAHPHLTIPGNGSMWLSSIGPFDPVTYSLAWPHGSDQMSWTMSPDTRHPFLDPGVLVDLDLGGLPIWAGKLGQSDAAGTFKAEGLWAEAVTAVALDASGNGTRIPDVAIDRAILRGALHWTRPASISASAVVMPATQDDVDVTIADLLDEYAKQSGLRWFVDPYHAVRTQANPTTPLWYVAPSAFRAGLTPGDDDFVTHLVGRYLAAGPTFPSTIRGVDVLGYHREETVDLTGFGVLTLAAADALLDQLLAARGVRLAFADVLTLHANDVSAGGGAPAPLTMVEAGHMVRILGVSDPTVESPNQFTDVILGNTEHTYGSDQLTGKPENLAARFVPEIFAEL